jgi:hypothetical protein
MEKCVDTYDHLKLDQEEISHLNRSTTINEVETAIKSLSKKKSLGPDRFTAELYQTFKQALRPSLLVFPQNTKRRSTA